MVQLLETRGLGMLGRISTTLFLMSTPVIVNSALAQNLYYLPKTFDGRPQSTPFQQAKEKWDKLSESEASCIENALRRENTSIKNLMQKGVSPTDAKLSKIRSDCQTQADASAYEAETKKKISELTEKLAIAQVELQQLRAETERLKAKPVERVPLQSQKGKVDPVKLAAQHNSAKHFIYSFLAAIVSIFGILFLIGLFVPKEWDKKKTLEGSG